MSLGVLTLLLAIGAAGWLLWRLGRGGEAGEGRNVLILKAVVWLGVVAALFAVKLAPVALMVLVAAAAVMGIEAWRDGKIDRDEPTAPPPSLTGRAMSLDDAAAILGLSPEASVEEVKAAHKKLIAQIHPDKGGTDYLAAQINQARDLLLRRLGE